MSSIGIILYTLLSLFSLAVIIRIVVEMIQSFSRSFAPPRWFVWLAEPIFMITDPPVKLLRRLIPPLRMGNVALDISVLVLFILLGVLQWIVTAVF